jgi:hypothetical protein
MLYATYFDKSAANDHITLDQWKSALKSVPNVRAASVATSDPNEWIGYTVNTLSKRRQFHDLSDRQYDAEVFCSPRQEWLRAFYWCDASDHSGAGVGIIILETPGEVSDPLWLAAQALAHRLSANLVGENDTKYEA